MLNVLSVCSRAVWSVLMRNSSRSRLNIVNSILSKWFYNAQCQSQSQNDHFLPSFLNKSTQSMDWSNCNHIFITQRRNCEWEKKKKNTHCWIQNVRKAKAQDCACILSVSRLVLGSITLCIEATYCSRKVAAQERQSHADIIGMARECDREIYD